LEMFNLSAKDAASAVDILTMASIKGIGTVSDFALGLSYAGATAASFGFSLEETVAALVQLDRQGISAEKAGRYLDAMFRDLIDKSDKLGFSIYNQAGEMLSLGEIIAKVEEKLASFGTEEERAAYLSEIFQAQSMRAILTLTKMSEEGLKGSETLKLLSNELNTSGTAMQVVETQTNTLQASINKMHAALEDAGITLGEAFSPLLEKGAELVVGLAKPIAELLSPAIKWLVEKVTGLCEWFERFGR